MVLDRNKVLLWFFTIFTFVGLAISIIIVLENLLPSIKVGKTFIDSNCDVLDYYTNETLIEKNQVCLDLNNDIWWYNTLGENDFYSSVVKHETHHNTDSDSSSSDSQYPNHTNSTSSSSSSDSSGSSSNSTNSSDENKKKCYVGLYLVSYTIDDTLIETNISGVWNSNLQWVQNYLTVFSINETYPCYYQSTKNENANWFRASRFSIAAVAIIGVSGGFTLISLCLSIIFFIRYRNIRNHYIRIITPTNHTGGSGHGIHQHHHQHFNSSYQGSFPN
ncbi:hypothetical protein CYY_004709 [Polysphondylium violaceum]|uniref:Uncharacterized protein n=1 Tax=Polysphondylium violaceum TaxID=133409 RepID=A0A8J4V7H3_9MYCE|nr:hypothetical protein CYY_004709 [Polysphondylium violaceum]